MAMESSSQVLHFLRGNIDGDDARFCIIDFQASGISKSV
jgi:hypothetical protein